jgi:hypothetical protein
MRHNIRSHDPGGLLYFVPANLGCSPGAHLPLGQDNQAGPVSHLIKLDYQTAASHLHIIGVRAEYQ